MPKVFVSGSFDMLHSGHVTFLKEASKFGSLYVGVGSDASIEKYKGHEPVCSQQERLYMIRAIRYVREAWINSGEGPDDFFDDIKDFRPEVIVVNEDQASESKEMLCWDLGIKYYVLKRTQEPGLPARSSTEFREMIEFDKDFGL